MKNYLKFVVAVFIITTAIFGSINAKANLLATGCDSSSSVCGKTEGGQIITGNYSGQEQAN
jgi:hypothetical protein